MRNWLEWIVFSVSAAIVVAVVGGLVYDASNNGVQKPVIVVHVGAVEETEGRFMVPIRVENEGDKSAEEVVVELASGEDKASLSFPFLPRRSHRSGWASFSGRPEKVEARVLGYREP